MSNGPFVTLSGIRNPGILLQVEKPLEIVDEVDCSTRGQAKKLAFTISGSTLVVRNVVRRAADKNLPVAKLAKSFG